MMRWMRGALVVATMTASTLVVTADPAAAARVEYCYGYRGVFKDDADVEQAYYGPGLGDDKCFGIAPDRTIWNAWIGSNGWQQLPNNGRADFVCIEPDRFRKATNNPMVVVYVNGKGTYTSDYNLSTGKWMAWRHEPGLWCDIAIPD
jgi:hypothetical protein